MRLTTIHAYYNSRDATWAAAPISIASAFEINLTIITASIPACKPFIEKYLIPSRWRNHPSPFSNNNSADVCNGSAINPCSSAQACSVDSKGAQSSNSSSAGAGSNDKSPYTTGTEMREYRGPGDDGSENDDADLEAADGGRATEIALRDFFATSRISAPVALTPELEGPPPSHDWRASNVAFLTEWVEPEETDLEAGRMSPSRKSMRPGMWRKMSSSVQ